MITLHRRKATRRRERILLTATVAASLLAVTACSSSSPQTGTSGSGTSGSSYGFAAAPQNSTATITVWVDASRQPAADAFVKAHPEIPIKVETYDGGANGSGSFQTKIEAFNQAGSGWPDVVFSTQNNDAAWASQGTDPFTAPLNKGYFEQSFLDGFTPGALTPTTVDGTVYGLRNDLAPTVTWEQYEALGKKVATEHPGYIVGTVGDAWTPEVYFWGAKAPINVVKGVDQFSSTTSDPKSVAMAGIIDNLVKAGSLAQDSVFSPEFV